MKRPTAEYDPRYVEWLRDLNYQSHKRRGKSRLRLIMEKRLQDRDKETASVVSVEEAEDEYKRGEEQIQVVQNLVEEKPRSKYFNVPISIQSAISAYNLAQMPEELSIIEQKEQASPEYEWS